MDDILIIDSVKFYNHPFILNYLANKDGDIYSLKSKKNLSKNKNNGNGYLTFSFYNNEKSKYQNYYFHRFVYEVFNGKIPKCMVVDHINAVKSDNRIKNLQLLSPKKNIQKSNCKPIISICIDTGVEKRYKSIKTAAEELNIFESNICNICKNKNKTSTSKKDGYKYTFNYLI